LGLIAVLVVAALVAGVVVTTTVRAALPKTTGTADLPGLGADVSVLRDDSGIPHLYGDSITDLARAQGYVHAQERFFEMDLRRHVTAGRLAELVGAEGLESDKVIRTMGWRRVAEEELPTLKPQTRQVLQAYAEGVNTYLRGRSPGDVAVEYTLLGLQLPDTSIEEWTPVDSISWLKAMAWDLRGNYEDELARARLSGRLSPAQIAQIYPPYDSTARPPILSNQEWSPTDEGRPVSSSVPSALTDATASTAPAADAVTSPGAAAAPRPRHLALPRRALRRRRRTTRSCPPPPSRPTPSSRVRWTRFRSSSAAVRASGRTRGWSPAPERAPASPCSPTTRTSPSVSPACGSRTACTAAPCRAPARWTSAASPSPVCPASSSATTPTSPGG
jgi:hypothetical protein